MKHLFSAAAILLFSISSTVTAAATQASAADKADEAELHRVMTCNIRITGLEADAPYPERAWAERCDLCVKTILSRRPDIVCMQEVIYDSYAGLKERLSDYESYGFAGPEMDPYTEGYHFIGKNVIFFRRDRYEFVSAGCYWLSKTPLIGGSVSWGTVRARHCNYVRLRDKRSGKEFRVLDLHLDHRNDRARRKQIRLVMEECAQYAADFPQILCGDFNAGISEAPIRYIRTVDGWREMYETIHGPAEVGLTAHAFQGDAYVPKQGPHRIDFIFYRGGIEVKDAEIVRDHEGVKYPSDHYFLVAEFLLQ